MNNRYDFPRQHSRWRFPRPVFPFFSYGLTQLWLLPCSDWHATMKTRVEVQWGTFFRACCLQPTLASIWRAAEMVWDTLNNFVAWDSAYARCLRC